MRSDADHLRLPFWPCLAILVAGLAVIPLDGPIGRWAATVRLHGDAQRELEVAQQFGDLLSLALTAGLIWLLDVRRRHILWLGVGAMATASAAGTAAKLLIGRARPKFGDPSFLGPWGTFDAGGKVGVRHAWEFWSGAWADLTSMPSSHTVSAAALGAFLAFAYPPLRGLMALLVIIVGVARVVLHAHYPSDVLVGASVGWMAGTAGIIGAQHVIAACRGRWAKGQPLDGPAPTN